MRTFVLLAFFVAPALAQSDPLQDLRAAAPADRAALVDAIVASEPALSDLVARLKAGLPCRPLKPGWHARQATDATGVERPYQVYIPKTLPGKDGAALVIHMHGGVARAEFTSGIGQVGAGTLWLRDAEEHGFVVAFPLGRQDCMWWSDAGVAHVRAVIRDVKRHAPIDDDRICATGFSDGGSGAFHLALAAPDPFASFLPLNGHPAVAARASGKQLYLRNLKQTPMVVAMTQDDQLYPARAILPHLDLAMRAGAQLGIISYPSGGHRPVYFEDQRATFVRFITDTHRDATPQEIEWQCAEIETGRCRWVEVLEFGNAEGDADALEDLNIMSTPGRVRLGIQLGSGSLEVTHVVDGSVAATMGMKVGDTIKGMDGSALADMSALLAALQQKKFGDAVEVAVLRGGDQLARLEGRIPPFRPAPYYRRDKPTARISVATEGNLVRVVSRNVRKFRLMLSPDLFGTEPVHVVVNGNDVAAAITDVTPRVLLERYARDADAGQLFTREALVTLK